MTQRKPKTRSRQHSRAYFRRALFEPLETRSLLAPLVNIGTSSDLVFQLPPNAGPVFLEVGLGPGFSQLRSPTYTFDPTPFAIPSGSVTVLPGNAVDTLTVSALPNFTADLVLGSAASGIGNITFAGAVNLGSDKSLTAHAIGTINFPNATSDLAAAGSGTISLTTARNMEVASGASINSVDGAISLAANQQATPTIGDFVGVNVEGGAIRATGAGVVNVRGKGGTFSTAQEGISIHANGLVQGGTGGVEIVGRGGTTETTGESGGNRGVSLWNGGQISAQGNGSVTVRGEGGSAFNGGHTGISLNGLGTAIGSNGGTVRVTGVGGVSTTQSNLGLAASAEAQISAGGTGSVIVEGTGGVGGAIQNSGILLGVSSQIFTTNGDVTIKGQGGGQGSSKSNRGVELGSIVRAGGSGNLTIEGTGGATEGDGNHGVLVFWSRGESTEGGNIRVTGTGGGTGTSGGNKGVFIQGYMTAGGSGNVTIQGTGGLGTGSENVGVHHDFGIIRSGSSLVVTGIEGAGTSGTGIVNTSGLWVAGSGSTLTVVSNSMRLGDPESFGIHAGATGTVTLRPLTSGTSIQLGEATDPIGGPLSVTNAELATIYTGTPVVGDANSGPITISETLNLTAKGLTLVTPAGVSGSAEIAVDIQGPTLGTEYGQLNVIGGISLTGLSLDVDLGYAPAAGDQFTILNNDASEPIDGVFQNLPERGIFTVTSDAFMATLQITYQGGDGNDVVLAVVANPWHNALRNLDVSGDTHIAPNDALEIINYINAFGAGPVPASATIGPPYLDVNGDNFVTAADVLDVINYLNAFGPTVTGGDDSEGEASAPAAAEGKTNENTDDWLAILAEDLATAGKRSRR